MNKIEFLESPRFYNPENAFAVHILEACTKEELLKQFSDKLMFPDYFGFNWDALLNCLRDFSWIRQKEIVLIHDNFPSLDEQDIKVYLEILYESAMEWKEEEEHYLKIIFPEDSKNIVQKYLANI